MSEFTDEFVKSFDEKLDFEGTMKSLVEKEDQGVKDVVFRCMGG